MAEWKKVLVSGSTIDVAALQLASTAVTSTAAELNLIDGSSAGTIVNSKQLFTAQVVKLTVLNYK